MRNFGHPYIVRTALNNGQKGYIDEEEKYLNEGNTISFGQDTATLFYQEEPYFTGDKIKVMKAKDVRFNKRNAFFFITSMGKTFSNFSWGASSFCKENIENQATFLPLTLSGEIDFDFMETFILELEKERIHKLEAYLKTSGLFDYNLTEEEKESLKLFGSTLWREFRIGDLFKSSNGDFDIQKKHINGRGDYVVSAGLTNNGIIGKSDVEASVFERETITIDMFGNAFYRQFPYKMVTHARVFSLSPNFDITDRVGLYLACALHFLPNLFGYENMCSWEKIKDKKIPLPLTLSGEIDFDFMELFIRAVQKTVIKNVVLFTDEKIKATKRIVNAP